MAMLSNQDVSNLDSAELDDLYAQLGRAADPAVLTVGLGEQNLSAMMASSLDGAAFWPNWIQRGLDYFTSTWSVIGTTVCQFYKEYTEIDNDWIENLAKAIMGLLNIGWAVALIIVQIVIKRGLSVLCPV